MCTGPPRRSKDPSSPQQRIVRLVVLDAVTSDHNNANNSIVIILFHTSSTAFPTGFVDPGVIVSAVISATFADGTKFVKRIAAAPGDDGAITFTTGNDGAVEGVWSTTGFSFKGTNGLKNFVVRVNNTIAGLVGELTLKSVITAEAHLPCVFDLGGRRLEFSGYGYHDKNWGDQPFAALIQSWYWGHGRLGPFSIVWFDAIGTDGVERVSGFVSDASKGYSTTLRVVAASCQEGAVSARPFGNNSEYPPHLNSGTPDGFVLVFQLGDGRVLNVTARTTSVILDFPFYGRYTGLLTGGVVGRRRTFTGTALWEQFRF
ncbi:hypothetical protein DFJ73DRAFT_915169 [Zopfochytrium polystomum]|nr:hypothetical protein DFJ73DRAFT_915169 [Zopfochytrium polystomum]